MCVYIYIYIYIYFPKTQAAPNIWNFYRFLRVPEDSSEPCISEFQGYSHQ